MPTVLVTGANGMLGQDLCPIFEDAGYEVIETDRDNLDVTNELEVFKFISDVKPDIVVHCAAYTNVERAEENIDASRLLNSCGTKNIALACNKNNATLVYISTDYVFDGKKSSPYKADDEPNPINNYGITKLEGENFVKDICEKFYIVRTSWLYGHHGKNFIETMLSLKDKEVLNVVDDQVGCPTWTIDLANGILNILNRPFGIYHICGSGATSWYNFAKKIFELSNLEVNLKPCDSSDFKTLAERPRYSVMDNQKLCPPWEVSLKEYLELRL